MNIPLVNLQRNYSRYQADYDRILTQTAATCSFVLGPDVREFEEAFADYLGVAHVVGVGSGTDALTLALRALGLPDGSTVLTQANTFIATTLAIRSAGLSIALSDCYLADGSMQLPANEVAPAAIIPVHLYGRPANIDTIRKRWPGVPIVEDAAQAHGSTVERQRCGSLGTIAAFSFYPGKNLGAFGDGGAVATNDAALADEVRLLRNWGGTQKYVHEREGGNSRLDNIQAAILRFKLTHLDEWNEQRQQHVDRYVLNLSDTATVIPPPALDANMTSCRHLFVVRVQRGQRDDVVAALNRGGVGAGIHYPIPIHRQPVYAELGLAPTGLPNSEERAETMVSLPLFPEMTSVEVDRVCETLMAALN